MVPTPPTPSFKNTPSLRNQFTGPPETFFPIPKILPVRFTPGPRPTHSANSYFYYACVPFKEPEFYPNPEIIKTMMKYNKGFGGVKVENENE